MMSYTTGEMHLANSSMPMGVGCTPSPNIAGLICSIEGATSNSKIPIL